MINSITIHNGSRGLFTNKLYKVYKDKSRTFNFSKDKINVITGRNASGKSVLLNLLKMKTGNLSKGISPEMVVPMSISKGFFDKTYYTMQEKIDSNFTGEYNPKVDIDWDGSITNHITPSFFDTGNLWDSFMSGRAKHYEDTYNMPEVVNRIMSNQSAGEDLINTIGRIRDLPKKYHGPMEGVNDLWMKASDIFQTWHQSFKQDEKPTLLIDELDKHLDLDNQKHYFDFLRYLAKEWQIIVVSHSFFAFNQKDVNYINLNPKYFKQVQKL